MTLAAAPATRGPLRGFQVDLRSLALFRITIGICLLAYLIGRIPTLREFYTDAGVLPHSPGLSLHGLSGQWTVQLGLILLAVVFALGFISGYRSRLCAAVSWVLLTSLHSRNPVLVLGGDDLLRLLLFCSIFVPVGARFSLDRALNPGLSPLPDRHLSPGTLVLVLLLCAVHWVAASSPDFIAFAGVATAILWLVGPLPALSPVLTAPLRLVVVSAMVLSYARLGLSADLALLPWVGMAAWSALLPGELWDWVARRMRVRDASDLTIWIDGGCGFCRRMATTLNHALLSSAARIREAQSDPGMDALMRSRTSWIVQTPDGIFQEFDGFVELCRHASVARWAVPLLARAPVRWVGERAYRWVARHRAESSRVLRTAVPPVPGAKARLPGDLVIALVFLLMVVGQAAHAKDGGPWASRASGLLRPLLLNPDWTRLAEPASDRGGWYAIDGATKDGSLLNVLAGGGPPSDGPSDLRWEALAGREWPKYLRRIRSKENAEMRKAFGDYLCRRWSRDHAPAQRLDLLWVYFHAGPPVRSDGVPAPRGLFLAHSCSGKPVA